MENHHVMQYLNINASKVATLTLLLDNKTFGPLPLQKLNQVGKSISSSLVQLPATIELNDSQPLTGHTSSISILTTNSTK